MTSEDKQHFYLPIDHDNKGTFSFDELPPGNYTLELKDQRDILFSREVTLEPGGSFTLPLVVDTKKRKAKVRESGQ